MQQPQSFPRQFHPPPPTLLPQEQSTSPLAKPPSLKSRHKVVSQTEVVEVEFQEVQPQES
jgi:hypothetical protein